MTYSICALDPETGDLGVAVQTRWFGVGSVVPWVEAGVGAVATQSWSEQAYGYHGLRLMREGVPAPEALARLVPLDADEAVRQVGMLDATGRAAAHTGLRCVRYAGHVVAEGITVQANMMERATVPAAMLAAFRGTDGLLEDRLFAALRAAEGEGGDVRGRQSAALVVARGRAGERRSPFGREGLADDRPDPWSRRVDLRVEDHRAPLDELGRLLRIAAAYDAMDDAETLELQGDFDAADIARRRSLERAPDDDQVVLWSAVGLALAGRLDEARAALASATAVEPRSPEHLRRFAEAGHLPGGADTLGALGIG